MDKCNDRKRTSCHSRELKTLTLYQGTTWPNLSGFTENPSTHVWKDVGAYYHNYWIQTHKINLQRYLHLYYSLVHNSHAKREPTT